MTDTWLMWIYSASLPPSKSAGTEDVWRLWWLVGRWRDYLIAYTFSRSRLAAIDQLADSAGGFPRYGSA
jgi:hypothetical protein